MALAAVILITAMICSVFSGCEKNNPGGETSVTTTTEAREYVDTAEGKTLTRTVNFGGNEKEITYKHSLDFGDGEQYDVYTEGDNEYRYIYNTDTIYKVAIAKFGSGDLISDESAMVTAMSFLSSRISSLKMDYEMRYYDGLDSYHKIIFAALEGKTTEFREIMVFIPLSQGVAEFWFDAK